MHTQTIMYAWLVMTLTPRARVVASWFLKDADFQLSLSWYLASNCFEAIWSLLRRFTSSRLTTFLLVRHAKTIQSRASA